MAKFIEPTRSAIIKVIGVGGCGCNTIRHMAAVKLHGHVSLYAINTDIQSLAQMPENCTRVQIGDSICRGLGVGGDCKKAEVAARNDISRIKDKVTGADMVFITAGMGGGTGTGAAPIIAEVCKEKEILTVAVVTKPFSFENRSQNADYGLEKLAKQVDSLIIVPNEKVASMCGKNESAKETFRKSDSVLIDFVVGICEIIYCPGFINVDFADVCSVMSAKGQAVIGIAQEKGEDRASKAAKEALTCPLLEGVDISTAKAILVNISGSEKSVRVPEFEKAMQIINEEIKPDLKVFFGLVFNDELGDDLRITLVATGLSSDGPRSEGNTSGRNMSPLLNRIPRPRPKFWREISTSEEPSCLKKNIS